MLSYHYLSNEITKPMIISIFNQFCISLHGFIDVNDNTYYSAHLAQSWKDGTNVSSHPFDKNKEGISLSVGDEIFRSHYRDDATHIYNIEEFLKYYVEAVQWAKRMDEKYNKEPT